MKYLITLFLLGMIFFGFAQSTNDDLLAQAKAQMDNGSYEASINILNKIHGKMKTKELVDYLLILNYANLLKVGDYPSYALIEKVRSDANLFCTIYPNSKNLGDVRRILEDMKSYPKTLQEYEIVKDRLLQEKKLQRQAVFLADIRKSYEQNNYVASLAAVRAAKESDYAESPVQYYDFMNRYRLFDSSESQTFNDVSSITLLGQSILQSGASSLSKLSTAQVQEIENVLRGLPKSLDEFRKNEEDRKAAAYALEQQQKFEAITADYDAQAYSQVILAVNDFAENSRERMKVSYYQAMSHYRKLKSQSHFEFSELSGVRSNLQAFLNKYADVDKTNKIEVTTAMDDLDKNYPNSQYAHDTMLKKQERKERAAIRRANLPMFSSIGYEYGKLAPYGLRFETGGGVIGFFTLLRYGLKSNSQLQEYDLVYDSSQPNKAEIIIGPNLKVTSWLFFNVGGGFGVYNHLYRNDYLHDIGYAKTGYLAGYAGVTFRLGNTINLVGGASLMGIDKKITKPEFTSGITFNLR